MSPNKYKEVEFDMDEMSASDEFELADIEYEHWKLDQEEKERLRKCY